jgi:farnesyl-diphosphate farnesyltransferase
LNLSPGVSKAKAVEKMGETPNELLGSLLRDVSRSFYLTLRILPARIRSQIGLAYLLARTTDTIADTGLIAPEKRLEALARLKERILGSSQVPLDFSELAQHQGTPAERTLLENCESSLGLLRTLSPEDLRLVRQVLSTITSGQQLDLQRFGSASVNQIVLLRSAEELDDYTYRVAGCVGEFWTKMCLAHIYPAGQNESYLLAKGVCFGQGLQLVNVLRDLPADLRNGRCYLPADQLAARGLAPEDLLKPENELRVRPVYDAWLERAEADLFAGWDYTNALPRGSLRVRLACAWPIQIGLETTKLLRAGPILDPQKRVKVSRRTVKKLMLRSVILYPFPAWKGLVSNKSAKSAVRPGREPVA